MADRGMAGGIAEKCAGEPQLATRPRVEAGDARDSWAGAVDGESVRVEKEVDVWLGLDDRFLLGILELLVGAGALFRLVGKLLDDLADPRILAAANQPHRPHANLARAVATEHWPILDECDLEPQAGGRDRRAHA
jgi:hypothetical protein